MLTDEQLQVIRSCSKDDQAFEQVLRMIADIQAETRAPIPASLDEPPHTAAPLREPEQPSPSADEHQPDAQALPNRFASIRAEIATALTRVVAPADLLLATDLSLEQHEYVARIRIGSHRLQMLLEDILTLWQAETGMLTLAQQPFGLRTCLQAALNQQAAAAVEQRLAITCAVADEVPDRLLGDAARLQQAIGGLLQSALHRVQAGPIDLIKRITLTVTATPLAAPAHLEDAPARQPDAPARRPATGAPTPETGAGEFAQPPGGIDLHLTMHTPAGGFSQAGASSLSLALSQRLLGLMGGTLLVEARADQSDMLAVHLRASVLTPSPQEHPGAPPRQLLLDPQVLDAELPPPLGTSQMARQHPLAILAIDDNPLSQRVLLGFLACLGYQAATAASGKEALAMLQTARVQPYDVILMAMQMPERDGIETTRAIRAGWPTAEQPAIFVLTAQMHPDARARCQAAGMNGAISRSAHVGELAAALARCWSRSSLRAVEAGGPHPTPPDSPSERVSAFMGSAPDPGFQLWAELPPPGKPGIIDPHVLASLRTMLEPDASAKLAELIGIFIGHTSNFFAILEEGAARYDLTALAYVAHTLKSSSASLGALQLTRICRELEAACQTQNQPQAVLLAARLTTELLAVHRALENLQTTSR